ncbi:glycosyltransferase family 32 protein [Phocaeicola sp.]
MIPKIIHLCWLSGEAYPDNIQQCLNTWKQHLPDYEIWLWDTKRFNVDCTLWTQQAFEKKKYAFVADYIRLYALYNYGGIYLDSDVIVYKSFNDLLSLPYFIGEDFTKSFEPAIIGAEKHNKWIGDVLAYYNNRPFIKSNGEMDTFPLPHIFYIQLATKYKFHYLKTYKHYSYDENMINIFSKVFFNSRNRVGIKHYPQSYCAHNYLGSWTVQNKTLKGRLKKVLPKYLLNSIYFITNKVNKKNIMKYSIHYDNKEL